MENRLQGEDQETIEVVPSATILYGLKWSASNGCAEGEIGDIIGE